MRRDAALSRRSWRVVSRVQALVRGDDGEDYARAVGRRVSVAGRVAGISLVGWFVAWGD